MQKNGMKKIQYMDVVFDNYVEDESSRWSQICVDCQEKNPKLKKSILSDAFGQCGIDNCKNVSTVGMRYIALPLIYVGSELYKATKAADLRGLKHKRQFSVIAVQRHTEEGNISERKFFQSDIDFIDARIAKLEK